MVVLLALGQGGFGCTPGRYIDESAAQSVFFLAQRRDGDGIDLDYSRCLAVYSAEIQLTAGVPVRPTAPQVVQPNNSIFGGNKLRDGSGDVVLRSKTD